MTPIDEHCYIGEPPLWTAQYDEIHISVAFTWDLQKVNHLAQNWMAYGKVKVGGPAYDDPGNGFEPGVYLRKGVTITSRGCPNNCSFCLVPKREGKIRELPIQPGHIVQDNNLLACSKQHIRKVFEMLRSEHRIEFSGGLESRRITDWVVEQLRSLSIRHIWLSYDQEASKKPLERAVQRLNPYFSRDQIRCYVLVGYKADTLEAAESRLRWAWGIGTLPFAMRYRTAASVWADTFLSKDRAWNLLARAWARPAIIKARML